MGKGTTYLNQKQKSMTFHLAVHATAAEEVIQCLKLPSKEAGDVRRSATLCMKVFEAVVRRLDPRHAIAFKKMALRAEPYIYIPQATNSVEKDKERERFLDVAEMAISTACRGCQKRKKDVRVCRLRQGLNHYNVASFREEVPKGECPYFFD